MVTSISAVLLVVYVLVLIALSYLRNKKNDFLIASRGVGTFASMASIVGNLRDGAGIAAWIALGYAFGFGALWLTVGLGLGLLLLASIGPKVRQFAESENVISTNEIVSKVIGLKSANVSSWIVAATSLLYSGAQVFVAGSLAAVLFGISSFLGIVVVSIIVGFYLVLSGYKATILTGIFQWLLIMIILLLPWMLTNQELSIPLNSVLIDPTFAIAFAGISFLVVISSSDLWQLIFSGRSEKTVTASFLWSIPVYFLVSIGILFFAIATRSVVGAEINPNDALFALFTSISAPPFVLALVGVFAMAAVMSTLDSQVYVAATTIATQYFSESNKELTIRILIAVTFGLLVLLALSIADLVQFLFSAVTLATVIGPVLIASILWPSRLLNKDNLVAACLCLSVGVYVYLFATDAYANLLYTLIPAAVSAMLIAGVMALSTSTQA